MAVLWSISAVSRIPALRYYIIAHIGPSLDEKGVSKISFESLRQFLKKIETVHNWLFLGQFRLCFSNPNHTMLITLHR